MNNIDTSLYGTNSNIIPNKSDNDNDFENRLYFTLLNKNMKNCNNLNSTNMSNCLDYYNNTPNNITNRLNSEYNNANTYIYSNPVNAKFQNYPIFDESNCRPISGKNRKYNVSASYTFPIINIHDKYITDNFTTTQIQSIKNLKINENISFTALQTNESIKFTRTNDIYPEQYRLDRTYNCNDKPYRTSTYIDSLWRQNIGCTMQLSQNIFNNLNTNYDDLQYIVKDNDVINKFNPYKLENITSNYEKFKECYGRDNISSYVTINEGNKSRYTAGSILLPGFKFNKLSGTDGIIILRNGDFTLKILDTGAINIYGLNNVILFNGLTIRSNSSSPIQNNEICMQHEGNLIISNINNSIIWNSGTNGNNGAYLELDTNGSLMIKKNNGDILKYIYISPNQLNTIWKDSTKCTQDLSDGILTSMNTNYPTVSVLDSIAKVIEVFNPFTAKSLISNKDTEKIKLCYGTDNNTGYVTVNTNNRSNYTARAIFPPGVRIAVKGIFILENGTYKYRIDSNGGCGLVQTIGTWTSSLMEHSYTSSNFGSIVMQHDGNLVIYSNATPSTKLWESGTGNNSGAYLELESNGSLYIKRGTTIVKYLYIPSSIINAAWKSHTGCSQDLSPNVYTNIDTTMSALQLLSNIETEVKPKFDLFTAESLISNKDTEKIKLCYGDHNNTGYVTVNTNNRSNYTSRAIFPPGIRIAVKGIIILTNGTYRYRITNNGGCGLVNNPSGTTIDSLMEHSYTESNFGSIVMEHGGNLVIFSNQNPSNILWQSNTGNNNGAYLELESNGALIIKKKDSNNNVTIIKYLYIPSSIQDSTWTSTTGCTQPLDNNILTTLTSNRTALSELNSLTSLANVFNPFTANSLITNKDTDKIKVCYGTTGYVTVTDTNKGNYTAGTILLPGFKFTATNVAIVHNSEYRLLITGDGQLMYVKLLPNWNELFSSNYTKSNFGSLVMQHDGNLVIFSNANPSTSLWSSGTSGNPGAYLELTNNGSLIIKKQDSSGVVTNVKYLYYESGIINTAWKEATGCAQDLSANVYTNTVTTMSDLQKLSNIESDVKPKFNPYNITNLYNTISNTTNKIIDCYGTTGYVTFTRSNVMDSNGNILSGMTLPYRIPRGVKFSTVNGNLPILKNGEWHLWLTTTGNLLMIYGAENGGKSMQLTNNTTTATFWTFSFEHNGYVSIHKNGTEYIWGTGMSYDNARYLELTSLGNLKIKDSDNALVRLVLSNAKPYLKYVFYDNCPNAMFADKEGRFFSFIGSDYPKKDAQGNNIDGTGGYTINDVPSNDDSWPSSTNFRGWRISHTNDIFTKTSERNLIHIDGYYKELNTDKPISDSDNTTYNYNSSEDRTNFFNDGGDDTIDPNKIRKPKQFTINRGGMSKSNYLPGYIRISYVNGTGGNNNTFKFLVSNRTGRDQAFVLFQKFHDRNTFTDSVFDNHPELITKINNDTTT